MHSKNIILTGASSGIGQATAKKLASEGHSLALIARSDDKIRALADKLPGEHLVFPFDLSQIEEIPELVGNIIEHWGQLDVLINNAGVGYFSPMREGDLTQWHTMFQLNVQSVLAMIHSSLSALLDSSGHIVNIASVAAHEVYPGSVVYCASKHALHALTVGLRKEYIGKIKVTDISPGAVETNFFKQTTHEDTIDRMAKYFNDVLKAEDVANQIAHVLSQPEHVVINEIILRPNR